MTTIELREHLGPYEVEIDSPLYGIMLVPDNGMSPVMTINVFGTIAQAKRHAENFKGSRAVVVRLNSTNA